MIITLVVACDRHRYSKDDVVSRVSLNEYNEPLVEKHAKRAVSVSDEERDNIRKTVICEGILKWQSI